MKAFRILTMVFSLGVILIFIGCGGKSTPAETPQEKQLKLLTATWKISSVTLDGVDQTSSWTGFQLTISGDPTATTYSYTCASRAKLGPWPASGTWTFGSDPVTKLIRTEDNLPMSYTVIAATTAAAATLTVNFNFTGSAYPGPRVSNVTGNWIFNFTN